MHAQLLLYQLYADLHAVHFHCRDAVVALTISTLQILPAGKAWANAVGMPRLPLRSSNAAIATESQNLHAAGRSQLNPMSHTPSA